MTLKPLLPVLLLASGCAHLGPVPSESWERRELWDEAHEYFAAQEFEQADSAFTLLVQEHPQSDEGREALFYLGALYLDPRNPGWDSEPSEEWLARYLAADTEEGLIHRRPEGETLYELAHQLNLPMEDRIKPFQVEPQTRVVIRAEEAQGANAEIDRLRSELAARDLEVQQLKEELDRIRKTLTGGQ